MDEYLFNQGLNYAENNFLNDNAPHLKVDKELIKNKFNLDGLQVLDFGCGMGGMTLWYATHWNCKVYSLDIDSHHIEIANKLKEKHHVKNVTYDQRDIIKSPLREDEKFDFIFMNDVVEHIPFPILRDIIGQLIGALSKNGRLFITYPPWRSPYASHVSHVVGIPWCQFLPQNYLLKKIKQHNRILVGEEESDLVQAYNGLNRLTHDKFLEVIKGLPGKITYRKSHSLINKISIFRNVNLRTPPLDFLVSKEFLLLEKAD